MKYTSNSREHQDFFVISVMNGSIGTYFEIGCSYPVQDSNTFLLENDFNWTGLSIDNDSDYVNSFNNRRKNRAICADATKLNYDELMSPIGTHIDYLQFDISPSSGTFTALTLVDFQKYSFNIITYEHDFYAGGIVEREESRRILYQNGYTMVVADVMHGEVSFEDWYVNEKYMTNDNWKQFYGSNIKMDPKSIDEKYKDIFENIMGGFAS